VTNNDEIRQLVDDFAAAVRSKNVDAVMSNFAPNVMTFDVVGPLQSIGTDAARKRSEEWFASFEGPIGYQIRDLTISAAGDIAFCHSLNQRDEDRRSQTRNVVARHALLPPHRRQVGDYPSTQLSAVRYGEWEGGG
jgi:ketosteroid isomerase-like protein